MGHKCPEAKAEPCRGSSMKDKPQQEMANLAGRRKTFTKLVQNIEFITNSD